MFESELAAVEESLKKLSTLCNTTPTNERAWLQREVEKLLSQYNCTGLCGLSPPVGSHWRLLSLVNKSYWPAVEALITPGFPALFELCAALKISELDELGEALVPLAEFVGSITPLFASIIDKEVADTAEAPQLFRVNSLSSKMMVFFVKRHGQQWLRNSLAECFQHCVLLETNTHHTHATLEINPDKLKQSFGTSPTAQSKPDQSGEPTTRENSTSESLKTFYSREDSGAGTGGGGAEKEPQNPSLPALEEVDQAEEGGDGGGGGAGMAGGASMMGMGGGRATDEDFPVYQHSFEEQITLNQCKLEMACGLFVKKIVDSLETAPMCIRVLCHHLQRIVSAKFPESSQSCVGGLLFLRVIVPFLLTTKLPDWHLHIDTHSANTVFLNRNIVLIVKVLQNLANGVKFGSKEPFMECMNDFIEENMLKVEAFCLAFANPTQKELDDAAAFPAPFLHPNPLPPDSSTQNSSAANPVPVVSDPPTTTAAFSSSTPLSEAAAEGEAGGTVEPAVPVQQKQMRKKGALELDQEMADGLAPQFSFLTKALCTRLPSSNSPSSPADGGALSSGLQPLILVSPLSPLAAGGKTLSTLQFASLHPVPEDKNESDEVQVSVSVSQEKGDKHPELIKLWVKDSAVNDCPTCARKFTMKIRKHHCRSCGLIFCANCSARSACVSKFGFEEEVRVCDPCYAQLKILERSKPKK